MIWHVTDYVTDHAISENFHPLFFTTTIYCTDAMDNDANNLRSENNTPNDPSGGDNGHGRRSNTGNAGGKGKGKKRATTADMDTMAEEEEADAHHRELMQCCDEALTRVQADIAAAKEQIRMEELNRTRDTERLFMLQALDPEDPEFERMFEQCHNLAFYRPFSNFSRRVYSIRQWVIP
jgi:hypothetical protein